MGAGVDPSASAGNFRDDDNLLVKQSMSPGVTHGRCGHHEQDMSATAKDIQRACRAIRGGRRSEVLEHVKKQTCLLTRLRWGHSLHKVARDAMEEPRRGESRRLVRSPAAPIRNPQKGLVMPEDVRRRADPANPMPSHSSKDATGNNSGGSGTGVLGNGSDQLCFSPSQTCTGVDTNNLRGQYPVTHGLHDAALVKTKGSSLAPAHGGAGDTIVNSAGQPVSALAAGSVAAATVVTSGMAAGRAGTGAAGTAGGKLVRKGRGMGDRVARLGLALDDVQTRADRAGGRASRGIRARSGQRLNLPCSKRHIKIVRAMTLGDAGAAAGNMSASGGGLGTGGSSGTGGVVGAKPNGLTANANGLCGGSGVGGSTTSALLTPTPTEGLATTAAATVAATATTAAVTPVEGAVSLRTVGKTVAFLARVAAPADEGRDADGGAFAGGVKMAGGGGTGSSYGPRQCWYSAEAAKTISAEAHEEGGDLEEEGEAALALERLLHAPPAIQFIGENRRGGFNKGSTITYGSTITLQAFHGGILCFNGKGKAQASALGAQPNALLTVWNLQDLQSKGPVKFGDVLFLQMGRHEVMGSSLIMHKEPKHKEGTQSSQRVPGGAGSHLSDGAAGEQELEETARDRAPAPPARGGSSKASTGSRSGGGVGGASQGNAGAVVGNAVAVPFRGKNMDKAKHTGRWVIFHKDEPEATQGSEVCHLDKVVLMQTWLSLASDRPSDACLKQCGSVDDYCYRQKRPRASTMTKGMNGAGDGGNSGDAASVRAGKTGGEGVRAGAWGDRGRGGGRPGSRHDASVSTKSAFTVRPECGWVISGVGDSSGSGKRAGTGGTGGRSSSTLLEGVATRQLRRSKNARMVVAMSAIIQMRSNAQSIVLKAQEIFDEGQRRRLASLGQKFLRAFRRERARDWLPDLGGDRQLSIVYGPTSPWGKREALRMEHEQHKQSAKVTAKARTGGDVRYPTSFEVARAENEALATEAKVKQEVWEALLKRYGYQEVTDMLALMHSASVIRRAVRAMRQRKWTRKLARIDPEIVEKVERLRKIQEQRKANMRGGTGSTSTVTGMDTAMSTTNPESAPVDDSSIVAPTLAVTTTAAAATTGGKGAALASSADPCAQRSSRPYEAFLAGSLEKFEKDRRGYRDDGIGPSKSIIRPQTTGGGNRTRGWGSRERCLLSSGRQSYSTPAWALGHSCDRVKRIEGGGGAGGGRGGGGVRGEKRLNPNETKTRANARPKTAGSGGVEGVLARMRHYEKSAFLEFGGDGMGGAVDQQLSRDVVLLDDLRGTLNQVMAWDHTQGVPESFSGAGVGGGVGSGGGLGGDIDGGGSVSGSNEGSQGQEDCVYPTSVNGLLSERAATSGAGVDSETHGDQGSVAPSSKSAIEDETGVRKLGMEERIPVVLGRRAGNGVEDNRGDNWAGFAICEYQETQPSSPGEWPCLAGPEKGGGVTNGVAKAGDFDDRCGSSGDARDSRGVTSDDTGSTDTTTTSATTTSSGSCSKWVKKQQKRKAPTPLTDDERMSILQHIRPSVFGEPLALSHRRVTKRGGARPQSAAAAASGCTRHGRDAPGAYHDNCRHQLPRASTARRRVCEGDPSVRSEAAVIRHQQSLLSGEAISKHGGVLVQDGWVAGERRPPSCMVPKSTEAAASASLQGSTHFSRGVVGGGVGSHLGSGGGRTGGVRPVSLVNSVAFGVNMGVLDALSDTMTSASVANAFASAAAGESAGTAKFRPRVGLSSTEPWSSVAERNGNSVSNGNHKRPRQSTGRRTRWL